MAATKRSASTQDDLLQLNLKMKNRKEEDARHAKYHGDNLMGEKPVPKGFVAGWQNTANDVKRILTMKNAPAIGKVATKMLLGQGLDIKAGAGLLGSMADDSNARRAIIEALVKSKYDRMLHPPLTYLGDAFQYRTADGKFNSVLHPHLGQAGAPYAKTVPSKTHPLGALPDPGDLFDKLMARQEGGRVSQSGLSSMLIYHATIIIHDIFRTNEDDKNISDSSSYLDLSPLYGYTMDMQRSVRDNKYKLGMLKPDTFAEDRLLRQPPGVCIMLVMYNRYHNYAAAQLRRINENGRFSVPKKYDGTKLEALAKKFCPPDQQDKKFYDDCRAYNKAWKADQAGEPLLDADKNAKTFQELEQDMENYIATSKISEENRKKFEEGYDAAWNKLDDDLFNTARLITCGIYIQVSIHDYLRALMGFHQFDTNFTLDPRLEIDHRNVSRGIGNQVTVEFNLLYRFHCAISLKDEKYTEDFMKQTMGLEDPTNVTVSTFLDKMRQGREYQKQFGETPPEAQTFGLPHDKKLHFQRNPITNLFNDQQMIDALTAAMDDPISNFGPRNTPKCLKPVEILGILQARKWEIGTLNDFREFFGMPRHENFESITKNFETQNALRDLYEHPDMVELYPGVFCESDENMGVDPGPSDVDSALWAAIFSDAITLVRSDRFYTVDWNTNSLTSWGMKEVTPDNDILKSSVFHRLIQRAFPGWFPYDSIRFFHPFYTAQQNAEFAKEQGYAPDFRMSQKPDHKSEETGDMEFTVNASNPVKPWKPVYLKDYERIHAILTDESYDFFHPSLHNLDNLPPKVKEVFESHRESAQIKTRSGERNSKDQVQEDPDAMLKYFKDLMRSIIERESIAMNNTTYQIDVSRDFAIPVVTRYVADFLGFGHLIRSDKNSRAPHSENEIYRHITNCQTFLSYNADETKLLKRRKAFRSSMEFLFDLTQNGNIAEANKWKTTQYLFGRKRDNPMTDFGFKVAEKVIEHEGDADRAAGVLLFVGLDLAYNTALAFTSVLNEFMGGLYQAADPQAAPSEKAPKWFRVQELAFGDAPERSEELRGIIQAAEGTAIRLPLIRTARNDRTFQTAGYGKWSVKNGQSIILDIHEAKIAVQLATKQEATKKKEIAFLTYQSTFMDKIADYHPSNVALMALTSMVVFVAQMRNPRRGHDAQGRVKRVKLDSSAEGYSNFMAPMRVKRIAADAEKSTDPELKKIYTKEILKPATDTYLTAEWDEMIPFPTTWKIRFDGFGKSDYSQDGKPAQKLFQPALPDDAPPFYQPQGASHVGGSFADVVCICATPDSKCTCFKKSDTAGNREADNSSRIPNAAKSEPTLTTGCSVGR